MKKKKKRNWKKGKRIYFLNLNKIYGYIFGFSTHTFLIARRLEERV